MENTMQVPDALPILSSGHHPAGSGKACIMDAISWLQGKPEEGDAPSCVHPVLRSLAIKVNDNMADADRWQLWGLVPRLIGTADLRDDVAQRKVLNVRLAIFAARSVLHLAKNQPVALAAIRSAEVWCDEPTEENRLLAKDASAAASASAYAYAYASAAAYAAAYAAAAASAAGLGLLTGLIGEHERLTGHKPTPVVESEWAYLTGMLGVVPAGSTP
jgi:hypothetical protein